MIIEDAFESVLADRDKLRTAVTLAVGHLRKMRVKHAFTEQHGLSCEQECPGCRAADAQQILREAWTGWDA